MARLRAVASRRGVSLAQVVRQAVEAELARGETHERVELARQTLGAYHAGGAPLGRDHDAYVVDAFLDEEPGEGR